jgi:hypothetical protein
MKINSFSFSALTYIVGLLLVLSVGCESDPITLKPENGYDLEPFWMDSSVDTTMQNIRNIGTSSRLYLGGDIESSILITLNRTIFSEHEMCSDTVDRDDAYIRLYANLIDDEVLDTNIQISAKLVDVSHFVEDTIYTNDEIQNLISLDGFLLETSIDSAGFNISFNNLDSLEELCTETGEDYTIIVSAVGSIELIEFGSTNYSSQSLQPNLDISFTKIENVSIDTNRIIFDNISTSFTYDENYYNLTQDTDVNSDDFGLITILSDTLNPPNVALISDFDETYGEQIFTVLVTPTLHDSDITETIQFGLQNVEITTINFLDFAFDDFDSTLNSSGTEGNSIWDEGETWIDTLDFDTLDIYSIDPEGDDYDSETNLNGTEGNSIWDEGESFSDFGSDGIPEEFEAPNAPDDSDTEGNGIWDEGEPYDDTGVDGIFSENETGYNPNGTDGNGEWDWFDYNDSGGYDIGEGEEFDDFGSDGLSNEDEEFIGGQNLIITSDTYDYTYNFIEGDQIQFEKPTEVEESVLWISSISGDVNSIELEISTYSIKPILDIEFKLDHIYFNYNDSLEVNHNSELYTVDGQKLMNDCSLYSFEQYEEMTAIRANFGHGIQSEIEFLELSSFIENHTNAIISQANLICSIDTSLTNLNGDCNLNLAINNDEYTLVATEVISNDDEFVTFDIKTYLQSVVGLEDVNNSDQLRPFLLISDDESFNFNDVILYNSEADSLLRPRLEILFVQ